MSSPRFSCLFFVPFFATFFPLVQGPIQTPDAPNPKISGPPNARVLSPDESAALQDLVSRLLSDVKKVCKKGPCRILVTNFVLPEGDTSPYGIELADRLSQDLANGRKGISVVARAPLQEFFIKDRMRSRDMASEASQAWLARYFAADAVLMGKTMKLGDGMVQLSAHFLSASEKGKSGPTLEIKLAAPASAQDLTPHELYSPLPPFDTSQFPEKVYRTGESGAPMASCFYMPNPAYTQEARSAKFSGTIFLEAVIDTDGSVKAARVIRGSCCGLNEAALQAMTLWRCKSPTVDGKPVPLLVNFEVLFRLY
jgi:TonB family protein